MTTTGNRLEGKVAIVTGAGATGSGDFVGIGQAISLLFTRQGAKVMLVDRDEKNAETTLAQIKEEGGDATIFVGDVTNIDSCQEMTEAAVSTYGKLNVLVNNVGISGPGSVTDVDEDFWDTVIDVNLKSVMLTSKFAIPEMVKDGGGSIVNLSSIVGLRAGVAVDPAMPMRPPRAVYWGSAIPWLSTTAGTTSGSIASPLATSTAPWWPGIPPKRC